MRARSLHLLELIPVAHVSSEWYFSRMRRFRTLQDLNDSSGWQTGSAILSQRPFHAQHILQTIAAVAQIEAYRGHILAEMIHSKAYYALMLLEENRNQGLVGRILKRVAKENLPEERSDLLRRLESKLEWLQGIRNGFAHSVWGLADDLHDFILRIPSERYTDGAFLHDETEVIIRGWVKREFIDAYDLNDLAYITEYANRATSAYMSMATLISVSRDNGFSKDFRAKIGWNPERDCTDLIESFLAFK